MIRPQTTIEEILGNQRIELTRYDHSHQQTKPFEIAQLKPLETISSRSNGKDKTADDTIYTLQQIRDYNDRCVI